MDSGAKEAADADDSPAELKSIMRGRHKKTSRVTVKEEFLLLPPASEQLGKGEVRNKTPPKAKRKLLHPDLF